jgi:fatty acid desaturase
MSRLFRYENGALPNLLAFGYAAGGYGAGFALMLSDGLPLNFLGILLLAHAMVIAAYLVHECAHNTIFSDNAHNARAGSLLNWLTGACYGDYEDIRHKHFRHHVDRADVVAFDYRPRLAEYPRLAALMRALEWAYVPAVEIMMHALVLILPFRIPRRRDRRARVLLVLAVRLALLGALTAISWRILLFYPLAYLLFLTVLRFMDAHQHTYEIFETLGQPRDAQAKRFDAAYEHRNTFSNPISLRWPWLDLLVLNFGYHNAHHARPTAPWHRLPALHRELYGNDDRQVLPFANLLRAYHRYRVPRMLNADEGDLDVRSNAGARFVGVDGVSFLTAH